MTELTREEFIDLRNDDYPGPEERTDEKENKKLADDLSQFYPAEVIYLMSTENGKPIFERSEVWLIHPTLKIRASYNTRDKKYRFHCIDVDRLPFMNYYSRQDACKRMIYPQKIGKLTHKKIMEWINYLEEFYKRAKALNDANGDKITAFMQSIKDLPVRWSYHNKENAGNITINGIEFKFQMTETHIETTISISLDSRHDHSLENFLKLSDNKFK